MGIIKSIFHPKESAKEAVEELIEKRGFGSFEVEFIKEIKKINKNLERIRDSLENPE